jgi:hypothetical protein
MKGLGTFSHFDSVNINIKVSIYLLYYFEGVFMNRAEMSSDDVR